MLASAVQFDRIVIVDWSANSTPRLGADSIWIADDDGSSLVVENIATRLAASDRLGSIIGTSPYGRVLIGVDFSLGYPAGTAADLGLPGVPWRAIWQELCSSIVDDERNGNNRFDVAAELNRRISDGAAPFWGCPPRRAGPLIGSTKPRGQASHRLGEWRTVEQALQTVGRRPFSSWQLLGAGSVGSQSLLGIPVVERLRARYPDRVEVWPFTTGLELPALRPGIVVFAEIWPSLIEVDPRSHEIRDARQVEAVARWIRRAQDEGWLDALFSPCIESNRTDGPIVEEEGWVVGVAGHPATTGTARRRG